MSTPSWITPAGIIGVYPADIPMSYKLQAAVVGATITDYKLLSGALPPGLSLRSDGKISGTPIVVTQNEEYTFVARVTASNGTIKDRTFILEISGESAPSFITPAGALLTTEDSVWIELPILYNNPIENNPVSLRVLQGQLPPGLEINEFGLIRGYPLPPTTVINLPRILTTATATDSTNNTLSLLSTSGLRANRPVVFSGTSLGGLILGDTYYVKEVINATQITLTSIPDGDILVLETSVGFMDVEFPAVQVGDYSKAQYSFTLDLTSPNGGDRATYTITVVNQNLSVSQGGPGKTEGTRLPTIFNTRPPTYDIDIDRLNYGYYVLPPAGFSKDISGNLVDMPGLTYDPDQEAYIGQFQSDSFFSFHLLGHDFDNIPLTYSFAGIDYSWMSADTTTGWVYGDPSVALDSIEEFSFSVRVSKVLGSVSYDSPLFNFVFKVANNIDSDVVWTTPSNLGIFYNSAISTAKIEAMADVPLTYELVSGSLPPNLTFTSDGEIMGTIAYQPTDKFEEPNTDATFTFSIKASAVDSSLSDIITATKTFTMTVRQLFADPTDDLYIKCMPNANGRLIIDSLLDDTYLIPNNFLYRPNDANFGKAEDVIYAHAYGINSNDIQAYIDATKKNHYWRNITLGELSTAIARDEDGNVLYEVVYSNVIDNLMKYDRDNGVDYRYAVSVSEDIYWPRFIDLNLGPWYTSSTEIYTSYIFAQDAYMITNFTEFDMLTQDGIPLLINGGIPLFNTNLTPGYARILYPNSLDNMRKRVEQELGFSNDFRKLPLWMTSQQYDGNTLGYTPAWVICYTKPAEPIIAEATETLANNNLILLSSVEGMLVGKKIVFTGNTFGNVLSNVVYYVKSIGATGYPNAITVSSTLGGRALTLIDETGTMTATFDPGSYAEIIKERIENDWSYQLNLVDFQIDRFSVDKKLTYDYGSDLRPPAWIDYPSATPTPDPEDSENFYVLFPQKTILPTKTQYNL